MLASVQQYADAVEAADAVYNTAADTRQAAVEAAWTALGESDNAFVAWAVQNAGEYKQETLAILQGLPEDPKAGDVRRVARELGYDTQILSQAISAAVAAGALAESETAQDGAAEAAPARGGEARRRFLDQVRAQVGPHAVADVERSLNAILAEEAADHVARTSSN